MTPSKCQSDFQRGLEGGQGKLQKNFVNFFCRKNTRGYYSRWIYELSDNKQ